MNIKKMSKFAAVGGVYVLAEACFQCGKGYMLRKMKKHDLTVDEALDIVKRDAKHERLRMRINNKIIEVAATRNE